MNKTFIIIAMQLGSPFITQEALSGQIMKRPAVAFRNVQPGSVVKMNHKIIA